MEKMCRACCLHDGPLSKDTSKSRDTAKFVGKGCRVVHPVAHEPGEEEEEPEEVSVTGGQFPGLDQGDSYKASTTYQNSPNISQRVNFTVCVSYPSIDGWTDTGDLRQRQKRVWWATPSPPRAQESHAILQTARNRKHPAAAPSHPSVNSGRSDSSGQPPSGPTLV